MASPHSPYLNHPPPPPQGPSNYYHPPNVFGPHPYQYHQHQHQHQQYPPPSPRLSNRGAAPSRGGPGPHAYHHHPPPHGPYPVQHAEHYPQPKYPLYGGHHHHPHPGPYPPYQQSPSPTFTPPAHWQAGPGPVPVHPHHQSPLSPLPKQLGTIPSLLLQPPQGRGISPAYYEQPSSVTPHQGFDPVQINAVSQQTTSTAPPLSFASASTSLSTPSFALATGSTSSTSSASHSTPSSPSAPQVRLDSTSSALNPSASTSYTQTGSIFVTSPALRNVPVPSTPTLKPSSLSSSTSSHTHSRAIWAIWSRRPHDPSHAPGIIISPNAHPPPDVVQQALDLQTPPPSPPLLPTSPTIPVALIDHGGGGGKAPRPPVPLLRVDEPVLSAVSKIESGLSMQAALASDSTSVSTSASSSLTDSTVPSSSVSATERTDTPTVPGSPVSSHTSVSVTGTLNKEALGTREIASETEPRLDGDAGATVEKLAMPSELSTPVPPASVAPPPTSTMADSSVPSATTIPSPIPPAQPVKKSWASLFSAGSSSSSGSTSKIGLPTSNVVGISIPASAMATTGTGVLSGRNSELLALLTSGGGGSANYASAAASSNASAAGPGAAYIRPRGLVNSGNMCFANAVLQTLVYCLPFQRLFVELGRLLPVDAAGGAKGDWEKSRETPLVDAMIEFVKEFVVDARERKGLVNGSAYGNGNANGWGKGKEKEREREENDDDEMWEGESFIPTYVYDAMKENKRFDNMRGGQQEDAEEFFGFFLETLEEELLSLKESLTGVSSSSGGKASATGGSSASSGGAPVEEKEEAAPPEEAGWHEVGKRNRTVVTRTIKATESPISRIFGGKFRTTLRVPYTKKDSVIVEDWMSIRLDIQRDQIHTVQDTLSYISHPQPVQVTHPSRPGTTLEAQQQVHIEALPQVLVLHMKRFCYDTTVGGVVKVGKQVRFTPELEIGNDVMSPGIRKYPAPKYKLFGVLYHHGLSASGGHYTLDVLHPTRFASPSGQKGGGGGAGMGVGREGWVRIDDELVSDVRPEDVFGAWERDETRCAYLLFYKRVR
ncbi:hypothetical protein AX17_006778 [Amanita inopinata Kibby_2008]|nr:hypothetical protein AX17_006778 [Amanita inopinata Kibby_2008]